MVVATRKQFTWTIPGEHGAKRGIHMTGWGGAGAGLIMSHQTRGILYRMLRPPNTWECHLTQEGELCTTWAVATGRAFSLRFSSLASAFSSFLLRAASPMAASAPAPALTNCVAALGFALGYSQCCVRVHASGRRRTTSTRGSCMYTRI